MPFAKYLARLVVGVVLGASTVFGCGSGSSSFPLTSQCADATTTGCQEAGGADGGFVTCVQICAKADVCCLAATPVKDGGIPCAYALRCGATSSDDQLVAECRTFIALFPLNPSCQ